MKNKEVLNPISLHIIFSIFSSLVFNLISSIDLLMKEYSIRMITYSIISIILFVLYLLFIQKFLKGFPKKSTFKGILLILFINLILIISGFLYMKIGYEIPGDGGKIFIILFIIINYGFINYMPIIELFKLPEILNLIILGLVSSAIIYLGYLIKRKRYNVIK